MIRFSDIDGNPVLDTSSATTVGKLAAPVLQPQQQRVVAFRVKRSKGSGDVVLWSALVGLGPDAVTIRSVADLTAAPPELADRATGKWDVIGRDVYTEHGRRLGPVRDVEFDPQDGRVTALLLKDEQVAGERLLGIGTFAVLVRAD